MPNMPVIKTPNENPHREAIDQLVNRVLPIVRAMPFAVNRKEPWLGNAMVDKAVIATIETCFALAAQDKAAEDAAPENETETVPEELTHTSEPEEIVLPEDN